MFVYFTLVTFDMFSGYFHTQSKSVIKQNTEINILFIVLYSYTKPGYIVSVTEIVRMDIII